MLTANEAGMVSVLLQLAKQAHEIGATDLKKNFIMDATEIYNNVDRQIVEATVIPFVKE